MEGKTPMQRFRVKGGGGGEGVCSKGAHFAVHVQSEVCIATVVLTKNGPRRL